MEMIRCEKKQEPAEPPRPSMRDALYGDRSIDDWANVATRATANAYPWGAFVAAHYDLKSGNKQAAIAGWREIAGHAGLESMHYIQAWYFLRAYGYQPPAEIARKVLGVIVEVGMPERLDLVAAYPGYSARYYYDIYRAGGVVWERHDTSMDAVIDEVLNVAQQVIAGLELWNKPRPPLPGDGDAQVSILTPSGVYFGKGPLNRLVKGSPAELVVGAACALMGALVERARKDGRL